MLNALVTLLDSKMTLGKDLVARIPKPSSISMRLDHQVFQRAAVFLDKKEVKTIFIVAPARRRQNYQERQRQRDLRLQRLKDHI